MPRIPSEIDINNLKPVELKDIKQIIELMRKNDLSEFEIEKKEYKVKLKRTQSGELRTEGTYLPNYFPHAPQFLPPGNPNTAAGAPPANSADQSSTSAGSDKPDNIDEIVSPMIGTFYLSPSPEAEPFVAEGTKVTPDTVVCIIEAMKVMNEIKAEKSGVITRIVAENAKPIEYGQPLFEIKPE